MDSGSISEIKVILKSKDKRIELIMFSLMILLREKPDWSTVQKVVVNAGFLKRLKDIDKDKITEERIQKLEKFTQHPAIQGNLENFNVSVNILALYVKAVELYVKINLDVDPIRKRVMKLQNELISKEKEISELKQNLKTTLDRLKNLNDQFNSLNSEYQIFLHEFSVLEQRLERSVKLVSGLSSSQESWETHRDHFTNFRERIDGDVMLSSTILAYFGPFPSEYRKSLLANHLKPFLTKN